MPKKKTAAKKPGPFAIRRAYEKMVAEQKKIANSVMASPESPMIGLSKSMRGQAKALALLADMIAHVSGEGFIMLLNPYGGPGCKIAEGANATFRIIDFIGKYGYSPTAAQYEEHFGSNESLFTMETDSDE